MQLVNINQTNEWLWTNIHLEEIGTATGRGARWLDDNARCCKFALLPKYIARFICLSYHNEWVHSRGKLWVGETLQFVLQVECFISIGVGCAEVGPTRIVFNAHLRYVWVARVLLRWFCISVIIIGHSVNETPFEFRSEDIIDTKCIFLSSSK